jgi:ribokinase
VIVVVGSINMDLVVQVAQFPKAGETLLGGDYAQHPGGKGANQAVAAVRAGAAVRMIGRLGADAFGQQLKTGLATEGIDTGHVTQLQDVPSGVAFISVNESAQNCIIVSPGANARLSPEDLSSQHFHEAKAVLLQLEIPLETALQAARFGREAGATIFLNLAPAQKLSGDQLSLIDVLIVNESEAALLTGLSAEAVAQHPKDALSQLAQIVKQVVLTLGEQGAVWHDGADTGHQPAFAVTAKDTTAAGDAFVGALAVAMTEGKPLTEAVRFAAAAGALATTRVGAQPSLPERLAIESLVQDSKG